MGNLPAPTEPERGLQAPQRLRPDPPPPPGLFRPRPFREPTLGPTTTPSSRRTRWNGRQRLPTPSAFDLCSEDGTARAFPEPSSEEENARSWSKAGEAGDITTEVETELNNFRAHNAEPGTGARTQPTSWPARDFTAISLTAPAHAHLVGGPSEEEASRVGDLCENAEILPRSLKTTEKDRPRGNRKEVLHSFNAGYLLSSPFSERLLEEACTERRIAPKKGGHGDVLPQAGDRTQQFEGRPRSLSWLRSETQITSTAGSGLQKRDDRMIQTTSRDTIHESGKNLTATATGATAEKGKRGEVRLIFDVIHGVRANLLDASRSASHFGCRRAPATSSSSSPRSLRWVERPCAVGRTDRSEVFRHNAKAPHVAAERVTSVSAFTAEVRTPATLHVEPPGPPLDQGALSGRDIGLHGGRRGLRSGPLLRAVWVPSRRTRG